MRRRITLLALGVLMLLMGQGVVQAQTSKGTVAIRYKVVEGARELDVKLNGYATKMLLDGRMEDDEAYISYSLEKQLLAQGYVSKGDILNRHVETDFSGEKYYVHTLRIKHFSLHPEVVFKNVDFSVSERDEDFESYFGFGIINSLLVDFSANPLIFKKSK